jgi:hypothetical protein
MIFHIWKIGILQGTVAIIFGMAIVKSALLSTWIGGFGRFAGVATIIAGVSVAYIGFAYFEGKYLLPDRS